MRSASFVPLLLAFAPMVWGSTTVLSDQTCTTKMASKSLAGAVPTATKTSTLSLTATQTITSTPSATVTAPAVTSLQVVTTMVTSTVTEPTITDVYSSTSTNYVTSTVTMSTATTTTSTSTTIFQTTQTMTVATSPGFIPVASGLGFPGLKRRTIPGKFEAVVRRAKAAKAATSSSSNIPSSSTKMSSSSSKTASSSSKAATSTSKPVSSTAKATTSSIKASSSSSKVSSSSSVTTAATTSSTLFPQKVNCVATKATIVTETISLTAQATATITATPTAVTVQSTSTITTTTTIVPAAVHVTTIEIDHYFLTQTTTTTSTSTKTLFSTITQAAPSATFYAACAANNVVSSVNGGPFDTMQISGRVQPELDTFGGNAYQCCVSCITNPACAGTSFVDGYCSLYPMGGSDGSGADYGDITCTINEYFGDFWASGPASQQGDGQTISNGNCGQYIWGQGAAYRANGGFW